MGKQKTETFGKVKILKTHQDPYHLMVGYVELYFICRNKKQSKEIQL